MHTVPGINKAGTHRGLHCVAVRARGANILGFKGDQGIRPNSLTKTAVTIRAGATPLVSATPLPPLRRGPSFPFAMNATGETLFT